MFSESTAYPVSKGERALWLAVLELALQDAGFLTHHCCRNRPEIRASEWLLHDRADYSMVCEMAGIDPEALRTRVKRKLRTH